jgi:hypothetical protein
MKILKFTSKNHVVKPQYNTTLTGTHESLRTEMSHDNGKEPAV